MVFGIESGIELCQFLRMFLLTFSYESGFEVYSLCLELLSVWTKMSQNILMGGAQFCIFIVIYIYLVI